MNENQSTTHLAKMAKPISFHCEISEISQKPALKTTDSFVSVWFSRENFDEVRMCVKDVGEGSSTELLISVGDGKGKPEENPEKQQAFSRRKLFLLARKIIQAAKQHKIPKIEINLAEFLSLTQKTISLRDLGELLAVNFEMANFDFVKYKSVPKEGWNFVEEIRFLCGEEISPEEAKEFRVGVARGSIIGGEVNATRSLANTPGGEMTPTLLAQAAKDAAKGTGVSVKILGLSEIKKLKMGGVLGVSRGSDEEPKFIILEYFGFGASNQKKNQKKKQEKKEEEKPVVLVGKGVTFDSGGLNLKPSDGIYEMHMDMSGGAAVIHTVVLAAKLGLKKNVVALVPAVENMPSGSSYHPGDVLVSMSGKTIEVLNTDAEGRIILADALEYAKRYDPALVVDVATLTGAAMVALGNHASALFTRDENLEKQFRDLGEESGDFVWPLPLWEEYENEIKGTFGDWANTGKNRYGGAITAAVFLAQFTKDYPQECGWVHMDIAPRMTSTEGDHLAKGAAGAPVRLLIKLLEQSQ